jgi:hypothetical protein
MVATKKGSKKASKKGYKKASKSKGAVAPGTKLGIRRAIGTKLGGKKGSKKAGTKPVKSNCSGWKAVQDNMPPGPSTISVRGTCKFPNHYHTVKLTKAVPQGINPAILLLRKTVTSKIGIQTPQVVQVSFRANAPRKYTHVTILPDNVTVKVQQVF